jgi:hypothetical protein
MRVTGLAVALALCIGVASFPNAGMAASSMPAESPSEQQLASLGCIVAGTATAALVGTVGVMGAASTGGTAAIATPEALALMGAAFTAGCGVGMLAGPGAAWLIERLGYAVGGRDETSDRSRGRDALGGPVDLASARTVRR